MWAKYKQQSGFTIVELLIVIVVIGILAAISITAFSGVQQRGRDSERTSDVKQLKKALEMFYAEKNYYPSVSDVRTASFRTSELKIPEGVVTPPGQTGTIGYCWSTAPNSYCYVGRAAPGGSFDCGTSGEQCTGYTISYRLENDPTTRLDERSLVWQ
jgi:prepilin-type N-terminal cleavage/methylation domain-containing protein